jgi:hypothetical protein
MILAERQAGGWSNLFKKAINKLVSRAWGDFFLGFAGVILELKHLNCEI